MSATASFTNANANNANDSDMEIEMDVPTVPTVPTASPVPSQEQEVELTPELVMEYLPHLDVPQLLEISAAVNTLLKKHWKTTGAKAKAKAEKPKKPASAALKRTQAWTPYVLKHVTENGWEAFAVADTQRSASIPNEPTDDQPAYTYKDAKTGEIVTPAHIFEDTKKHLIYKDAMSLSSLLKWKTGEKPVEKLKAEEEQEHWSDLYREFMENYHPEEATESSSSSTSSTPSSTPSSPKARRLTAEEKEAEKEQKRLIAEEAKEQKRLAKEEEKEQKRLQKEAEKEQKRQEKEEEKRKKEEEKEAEKRKKEEEKEAAKVKKSPVPVAVAKKVVTVPSKAAPATPAPAKAAPAKAAPAKATAATASPTPVKATAPVATAKAAKPAPKQLPKKEIVWNIPEDGLVHPWTFQGKTYVVNADKCVWSVTSEGLPGDWVGMVDLEKGIIDTSVEEPEYDEE